MENKSELSMSQEDYLEKIYMLQLKNKVIRVTDLAEILEVSKPSVNRGINCLCEAGYIIHEHYGDIILTESGKKLGKNIYETHKMLKKFLVEFLGVDEKTADREACLMEHAISKGTRKKLKKYMKKQIKDK